jgi:ribonucleoside-triphosphate reductase (thioredoxin)
MLVPKYATKVSPSTIAGLAETPVPWGPTGFVVYKRTYARNVAGTGRTEDWHETVERGCNGLLEIGGAFSQDQIDRLAFFWHQLKGCPAGRPIWQLGTDTVRRLGGDSMNNCWVVNVDDPVDPFTFAFNQLMLGGGVGFNITPEAVYSLPPVKFAPAIERVDSFDCDFLVPDNREGWVELLDRVLRAFFFTGRPLRYCTKGVRDKGVPIRGFGGVASGPEDLVDGIAKIAAILRGAVGRKLRPIECLDILNIIGSIVVSGNVRRSAEIAIGDPYDREFLGAKDWSKIQVPAYRQMSNNTAAVADIAKIPKAFWRGYEGNGEPYGLINLPLYRSHGRLADGPGYRPDPGIIACNPCAEIGLESHEPCNLAEQFLPNIVNAAEFAEVSALLQRAQKAITCLPYTHPRSAEVIGRNRRLGLSITGFHQAPHLRKAEVLDAVYRHLEEEDRKLSREMGVPRSIKLTTVKPSGTLSLLAGVTPGMHAAYAPYYIRRITFAANDPLVDVAREGGYKVAPKVNIDGSKSLNSLVVDFPCRTPSGTQCAGDYPAVRQLEDQKFLQTYWADNSVSMTCYYQKKELPEIRAWLDANYNDSVKTCSFLLHQEHGFEQAPYEEITEAQFNRLSAKCRPITALGRDAQMDLAEGAECAGGACPVK